ncbi:MAG TPA: ParB/RepB/Spo0J family partition protein [Verrucomicrobiae bacterium]|nr:ParB/RepB/Spo0J family partition protein [Verrucomicrobiae bacterium]
MTKKALGRGLDALINGGVVRTTVLEPPRVEVAVRPLGSPIAPVTETTAESNDARSDGVQYIGIDTIERSRFQPRNEFDPEQLRELADSIKQRGVVQPLLVRPISTTATGTVTPPSQGGIRRFELIAGERRWRAAREAGLTSIPAIVRDASDQEALEIALIENLQREDLNAIEEAHAYEQLAMQFQLTQEQIAEKVGRSRAAVANAMRLLALPGEVQSWIADDRLSVGHAKAILGLSIAEEQRLVAERVLKRNLTVRETEKLVEQLKGDTKVRARTLGSTMKSAQVLAIEERLQQKLGTHVTVYHGRKKGRIEIAYYGNDDLVRLLAILGVENL